jgi:hypothetical protein
MLISRVMNDPPPKWRHVADLLVTEMHDSRALKTSLLWITVRHTYAPVAQIHID